MAETITIARPYAKALFEHALKEDQLVEWSEDLSVLVEVILNPVVKDFISNPASQASQQIDLLQSLCQLKAKSRPALDNLIAVLSYNKRLMLLPEIKALFEVYRAEQEKTLVVDVISFSAISDIQKNKLIASLSNRLQRKVSLNISIDTQLLGGAIIRAGDLVIDGSVRGKLGKLSTDLAA